MKIAQIKIAKRIIKYIEYINIRKEKSIFDSINQNEIFIAISVTALYGFFLDFR